jgi:phosphatidate phosphatase APP1
MPKSPFRRKPSTHGPASLFRFLFPQTRARARQHLSKFRHETFPSLKHRAQSRIYKYVVYRQALKLKGKSGILQRLRGHTRRLIGGSRLEDAARLRRQEITRASGAKDSTRAMSYQDSYESGGRRRKLAGYLKAANELRQTYTQQYAPSWKGNEQNYKFEDDTPGGFPDAAVVRSGEEEMILFPSYARKHIRQKPEAVPGTIQEVEGSGRDSRDSTGAGDAEFWKQQWENYEDDKAVVDVDVRGWIYSPFKGQMSRKQRLFIGLARQLVGIQAPAVGASSSTSSRDPSPGHSGLREGHDARQANRDEMAAVKEAEQILRHGEKAAAVAARGGYSEKPSQGGEEDSQLFRTPSQDSVRTLGSTKAGHLSHVTSRNSLRDDEKITPLQKRSSWAHPDDMNASELAEANANLMARLRHFLAVPLANTAISIFFYNDQISKQRTVYTNAAGHFTMSASLDFVPTHVRVLVSDKISATEEVIITESQGISVISDIDDTIKHSAISSGAREIFRNAFIRELGDLTIDGVKEWYSAMADMGVKFHYVSNSPWQLFPVISKYFALAGLPPGSFHLKQYSGMLQGIFEPVAERKKVTLDKIARDFPERSFILIGDSGEADLEVYTDFVLENPGRVVAVFIRDVTTSHHSGFFDPSVGPMPGDRSSSSSSGRAGSVAGNKARASSGDDDPEVKAAIAASLRQLDEDKSRRSKSMFPQIDEDYPGTRPRLPNRTSSSSAPASRQGSTVKLIDLSSDEELDSTPVLRRMNTDSKAEAPTNRMSMASTTSVKSAPPLPRKPVALRSPSSESVPPLPASSKPPAPPKPRQLSNTVNQPSPLSQQSSAPSNPPRTSSSRPPVAPKPSFNGSIQSQSDQSYAGMARERLWSVYSNLPALRSETQPGSTPPATSDAPSARKVPPPPPPPRRRDGATNAASFVGTKAAAAWQHAPSIPYHTRPQMTSAQTSQPFSTSSPRQSINRTSTGSTLGMNGGEGQYVTKREQMWRERWAKAEDIMEAKGVLLRSWRVGSDMMSESERIIQEAEKRWKQGGKGNRLGDGNGRKTEQR